MNDQEPSAGVEPLPETSSQPPSGGVLPVEVAGNPVLAQPPLLTLTKLKSVPVTTVWPTEPFHFTPWLLANSAELSEVLGMDVELEEREHKVGKYSLDLIGREVTTDRPVIVENQFGSTDHTHLGQLLTYAGGTLPSTVVWVAEDFREEHRAALDWLNDNTVPGVRFFGIRLAAVTLEGAPAGLVAPSMELVVQPNDYVAGASAGATVEGSLKAQLYAEFWATVAPLLKERGWTTSKGTTQNWWPMSAGVSGASWTVSFANFGCRSEIYFGHPDPAVNQARWKALAERSDEIQAEFGAGEVVFDDLPNNKGCRIETRLAGPKISDRSTWDAVRHWMVDTQERLRRAVAAVGGVPADLPAASVDEDGGSFAG
ncbi:DUF4268 domain-containing protein [Blastococcus sp. BMG 814]|uniref:DUF4268 domain-containing protein n=1 Tax=Blastococcus carthaginiensis TaxID=3050034 RepID=A0ABT9IFR8_9ACTN|nr:DUF4268 domain-containing protein [Blastococcus carthaginiensis]MDP5184408.1 DUF4268 domain-containing protein [Blastococcus carthaginiensis]